MPNVESKPDKKSYSCKAEAMARQCESCASFEGTDERKSGERGTGEFDGAVSVEWTINLVSVQLFVR